MTKFYNLPPSWNPGYADPDNVLEEGLERRAFVTAMLPRGTYSAPGVSSNGYAIPRYVKDEGYGQGAFVTKMLPRGYYGPKIPNYLDHRFGIVKSITSEGAKVTLKMATLGDDTVYPTNTKFDQFGQRSAQKILTIVVKLPASQRRAAIKRMLDSMDPALFARAERYATQAKNQGMKPMAALAHGLAAAITEGMLVELKRTGQSRSAPQANTLLGLGCHRAKALGAIDPSMGISASYGFTDIPQTPPSTKPMMQMGPSKGTAWFTLPSDASSVRYKASELSSAALADLKKQVVRASDVLGATGSTPSTTGGGFGNIAFYKPAANYGLGTGSIHVYPVTAKRPLYFFDHPVTGKRHGFYANFVGTTSAPAWEFSWREIESFTILGSLAKLTAWIVDVVKQAVDAVADLACGLVSSPGAAQAAAQAGGPAAGVGAGIAAGTICKPTPPPPPPPIFGGGGSSGTLLIAGGAALVLLAIVKKKKKAPTP